MNEISSYDLASSERSYDTDSVLEQQRSTMQTLDTIQFTWYSFNYNNLSYITIAHMW